MTLNKVSQSTQNHPMTPANTAKSEFQGSVAWMRFFPNLFSSSAIFFFLINNLTFSFVVFFKEANH